MKNLYARYQSWQTQRRQKFVEWWARKRSNKAIFLLKFVLCYLGIMLLANLVVDYYYDGHLSVTLFVSKSPYYLASSSILGFVIWWDNERRFHKWCRDEVRVKSETVSPRTGET